MVDSKDERNGQQREQAEGPQEVPRGTPYAEHNMSNHSGMVRSLTPATHKSDRSSVLTFEIFPPEYYQLSFLYTHSECSQM